MKKYILLFTILFCAPAMWAANCTSQAGGGNWDVGASIWSCGHVPTSGDTVTTASGNPITVENGLSTAAVTAFTMSGASPSFTIAAGGTFNCDPGAAGNCVTVTTGGTYTRNGAEVIGNTANTATTAAITINNGGTYIAGATGSSLINGDFVQQSGTTVTLYGCTFAANGASPCMTFGTNGGTINRRFYKLYNGADPAATLNIYSSSDTSTYASGCAELSGVCRKGSDPNGLYGTYTPFVISTDNAAGYWRFAASSGAGQTFNVDGAEFRNTGPTSVSDGTIGTTRQATIYHLLIYGKSYWQYGCTTNLDYRIDKLTTILTTTTQGVIFQPASGCTAVKGSGSRLFTNLAFYTDSGAAKAMDSLNITGPDFQIGESALRNSGTYATGAVGYNFAVTSATANSRRNIFRSFLIANDTGAGSSSGSVSLQEQAASQFTDSGVLTSLANSHFIIGSGGSTGDGASSILGDVFDGNNAAQFDSGDVCLMFYGTYDCRNNFMIGNSGTWFTQEGVAGANLANANNNTVVNSNGGSMHEASANATALGNVHSNIWYFPNTAEYAGTGSQSNFGQGMHMLTPVSYTTLSENNNYYYGLANSGDTNPYFSASTAAGSSPLLRNSTAAGPLSVTTTATLASGSTAASGNGAGTLVASTSIFTAAMAGTAYVSDTTNNLWLPITGYTSGTTVSVTGTAHNNATIIVVRNGQMQNQSCTATSSVLTCATAHFDVVDMATGNGVVPYGSLTAAATTAIISGAHTGATTIPITNSNLSAGATAYNIVATPCNSVIYGNDATCGSADQHLDPYFRDPTASIARWFLINSKRETTATTYANSLASQSGVYVITAFSGGQASITGPPSAWQANDPVKVYQGTTVTVRCFDSIATIGSGYITFNSGCSPSANDGIVNIAVTQGLGRAVITAATGFDYTGNPCSLSTCYSWATPKNLLAYIKQSLTPMNGMFKNAANSTDCNFSLPDNTCDVGAVSVFPAAILSSN